jgi:hypothetical protein
MEVDHRIAEGALAKGRKTGGRLSGTPNKTTVQIREAARAHGDAALAVLAHIMAESASDTARIAAAREILDRAYGKAPQAMTGEGGEGPQRIEVGWKDGDRTSFSEFLEEALRSEPQS